MGENDGNRSFVFCKNFWKQLGTVRGCRRGHVRCVVVLLHVEAWSRKSSAVHPATAGYSLFRVVLRTWTGRTGCCPLALAGMGYRFLSQTQSFGIHENTQIISVLMLLVASGGFIAMGEARREGIMRNCEGGTLNLRISEERTAELDTANMNLRDLSARLLQLQDDERRRIARGTTRQRRSTLARLSMNLSAVRSDMERLTKPLLFPIAKVVQEMSKKLLTISPPPPPALPTSAG